MDATRALALKPEHVELDDPNPSTLITTGS
jgi:hypothetical protein